MASDATVSFDVDAELRELVRTLVRALLLAEWPLRFDSDGDDDDVCSACDGAKHDGHDPGCPVDSALTLAGLATRESRDAARERMRHP